MRLPDGGVQGPSNSHRLQLKPTMAEAPLKAVAGLMVCCWAPQYKAGPKCGQSHTILRKCCPSTEQMSMGMLKNRAPNADRGLGQDAQATINAALSKKANGSDPLEPYIRAVAPLIVAAAHTADALFPYVEKAWDMGWKAWKVVAPYRSDWWPIVFGLMLIFFGGSLPLTIAAVEAFRLCGW